MMAGLLKTILLFMLAAFALAYANEQDVRNRYPPIDVLLWVCLGIAAALSVRFLVEVLRSKGEGENEGSGEIR